MFKTQYELHPSPIPSIFWTTYVLLAQREYDTLLENYPDDEKVFQEFFERNPSFIPGAFELRELSGHLPHLQCLISQPEIGTTYTRKPDFLWLSQDSLTFVPVFIEIEKPSKKTFTKSGQTSADFTQAMDQILEWKSILNTPENQIAFFKKYNLPQELTRKTFKPQFILIYGRRSEYEGNEYLTRKRSELQHEDVMIMSYDRLHPIHDIRNMLCANVSNTSGNAVYTIKTIPPTFELDARLASDYKEYSGFVDAIDRMEHTTPERKSFLKERFPYWCKIGPTLHFFDGNTCE